MARLYWRPTRVGNDACTFWTVIGTASVLIPDNEDLAVNTSEHSDFF